MTRFRITKNGKTLSSSDSSQVSGHASFIEIFDHQSRNASRRSKSLSPEPSNVETSDANLTRSESPGRYSNLEPSLRSFDETVQSSRSSRRRRRTRELSSSSDESSMTRQQSRSREKWYEQPKPLDNADVPLRDRVWPFGLNLIKRSSVAAGRDYWNVIRPLINDKVMRARNGQSHPYTWQIYDKNGHLFTDKDLNETLRRFTRKVSSTQDKSYCTYDGCDISKCENHEGKKAELTSTVVSRLSKTFATWYCVCCQSILSSKGAVTNHGRACIFQGRADLENPETVESSSSKKLRGLSVIIEEITTSEDFEEELNNFLEKIHCVMQASYCYPLEKDFDTFITELKQKPPYKLIEVFKKFHYSPKKFHVNVEYDSFYQIIFESRAVQHPNKSRSPRFQIIEVSAEKAISIHRLVAIRNDVRKETKCNYHGCKCNGTFETDDSERLVGHVFGNNICIACVACKQGFRNIKDYEAHLRPKCWLPRPKKK